MLGSKWGQVFRVKWDDSRKWIIQKRFIFLYLNQILNGTSQHLCKAVNGFHTGLVDILVSLSIHLDRPKADFRMFGQFNLGAAVGGSDAFEIGFCETLYHYGDSWAMGILFTSLRNKCFCDIMPLLVQKTENTHGRTKASDPFERTEQNERYPIHQAQRTGQGI